MADVNSTLIDVCNEIALALQKKLNTTNKFKPINYGASIETIGSEANATASDVKLGKKVYVGDNYVDGTFEGIDLNVSLSLAEQTFEPETGKYYKKVVVPAASAPVDVWDGTGIVIKKLVDLISFTIDGTSYNAEKGSTWGEWANSEYNTVEARFADFEDGTGMQIKVDGAYKYIYYNEQFVQNTDSIVVNGAYTTTAPVVEDDSIVGTWVFNHNLYDVGSTSLKWKGLVQVPFSSGSYSNLEGMKIGNGTLSYCISVSQSKYVNNGASVYSSLNGGTWNTSVYKTINILSDDVTTDTSEWSVDDFKAWLKANATKQTTNVNIYDITVNNNTRHYEAHSDNPTQIKEGETVTLTFSTDELYHATASATNATCTYSMGKVSLTKVLTVTLSNATDNVVVTIDAETDPEPV